MPPAALPPAFFPPQNLQLPKVDLLGTIPLHAELNSGTDYSHWSNYGCVNPVACIDESIGEPLLAAIVTYRIVLPQKLRPFLGAMR
jgi:hypothetical protein